MDSGYEAIIVEDTVATTNGLNGNHEDVTEMKTRLKTNAAADDESSKAKLRATRSAAAAAVAHNDKAGSDSEKKDKKINLRSSGGDAEDAIAAATALKAGAKEATANANNSGGAGGAAPSNAASAAAAAATGVNANATATSRKPKGGEDEAKSSAPAAPTPAKKKVAPESNRDDDSGINSRASSVSNDDIVTPARMRTRSSRAAESATAAATSTPAYRKSAARVPISIYEFDAASFDDDVLHAASIASTSRTTATTSLTLKRKAAPVVYIEEMMDEAEDGPYDEAAGDESGEPLAKKRFLISAGSIVGSLLYPLRAFRNRVAAIRSRSSVGEKSAAIADQTNDVPSADGQNSNTVADVEGESDAVTAVDESGDSSSLGDEVIARTSSEQQQSANTCSVM